MTSTEIESAQAYQPRLKSRSEYIDIRGRRLHLRRWGNEQAPLLFCLHGWMDISASFQFIVDQLQRSWNIIAVDWANLGLSEARPGSDYFFQNMADLDALLAKFSPEEPARFVAHSMGCSLLMMYAGARPERVSHVINMEGVGPIPTFVKHTGDALATWLATQRQQKNSPVYRSVEHFAERLMAANSRLSISHALYLANEFTFCDQDGNYQVNAAPAARAMQPVFPHHEQVLEVWQRVSAQVLFLLGSESHVYKAFTKYHPNQFQARLNAICQHQKVVIDGASHNMLHEYPQLIAAEIERVID